MRGREERKGVREGKRERERKGGGGCVKGIRGGAWKRGRQGGWGGGHTRLLRSPCNASQHNNNHTTNDNTYYTIQQQQQPQYFHKHGNNGTSNRDLNTALFPAWPGKGPLQDQKKIRTLPQATAWYPTRIRPYCLAGEAARANTTIIAITTIDRVDCCPCKQL